MHHPQYTLLEFFEMEGHMTFHLFVSVAWGGGLPQCLSRVAFGNVGYDDGTILWHFLPITHFLTRGTRPRALRQDFESYFQDGMSYDIPSLPKILRWKDVRLFIF